MLPLIRVAAGAGLAGIWLTAGVSPEVTRARVDRADPPSTQAGSAGHWPQWRGPNRDGVSPETGLLTTWPEGGPRRVYAATGIGLGFSSLAVTGGRIYTMGDRSGGQFVIALDEASGREVWATRIGSAYRSPDDFHGPRGTPTVDGDLLFVVGTDGQLVCLETATGRERWRKRLDADFGGRMMSGWNWSESPLVDGERVVVTPGAARAGLAALDRTTGREIWRAAVPRVGPAGGDGAGYSSVVVSNAGGVRQYVQLMGRGVVGVRASDGWYLWGENSVANNIANITTPIVRDNFVFATSSYGTGAALIELAAAPEQRVTSARRWFVRAFENHHGGVVLIDGYLYGGHGRSQGFPMCLEFATGRSVWPQTRGAGTGSAAIAAADGHLYFRYQDGVVALVEATPAAYRLKGRFTIPNPHSLSWPHPVIAGGRLYLREQDTLHVYDVRRPL